YSLVLAAGVRPVAGIQGWETGTFLEGAGIENWNDAANYYGVSVAEARRFLAANYPKSTAELNRREAELEALAAASGEEPERIVISFGSPTNRLRAEGFWDWPIVATLPDG